MWNKDFLAKTVKEKMGDYLLVVASNRQPYSHTAKGNKVLCQRQPGGLVTGLNPVMDAIQGTWIATGTSAHDRAVLDSNGKVKVPTENPSYDLRRIFLSKQDTDAYYYGYSNEGLWPLCHVAYTRPAFSTEDWKAYEKVNRLFAETILDEVGNRKAFIWVQDFHLALVAKYLRQANQQNIITAMFWHIPWPNAEIFGICPQKKEILEGLLAYDLLGFQIRYHHDNFLATVDREIESRIDREKISVTFQNHETLIRAFPISIDCDAILKTAESAACQNTMARIREELDLGDKKMIVSIDRLDYTKGIPEKLKAIDRFLDKYPEYKEKFVFFQLGQISRLHIPRYKQLNDEVNDLVEQINWKHSQGSWAPIVLKRAQTGYDDVIAYLKLADCCIVGSLHDGMNLVAKEFVAARTDLRGVLILSNFTGAARELTDALSINPYDPESFADSIYQALEMPTEEQTRRLQKMREIVAQHNIYRWAGKVLSQLLKFEFQEV